jgi:hypothetical protein
LNLFTIYREIFAEAIKQKDKEIKELREELEKLNQDQDTQTQSNSIICERPSRFFKNPFVF